MTSASDQSSPILSSGFPNSSRNLEFAEALDRYIASYDRRETFAQGSIAAHESPCRRSAVRQLGGFIAATLTRLGSAMSADGRSSAVGIM
jgi:hypothetical protein